MIRWKSYINPVITCLLLTLLLEPALVLNFITLTDAWIIWSILASTSIIIHSKNFTKKVKPGFIDYLKLMAVILVLTAPPLSFQWGDDHEFVWVFIAGLIYPVAVAIYVYDRFILKPEPMKKKFVIVLIIQTLVVVMMLIYAFVQQVIAKENERRALEAERETYEQVEELHATRSQLEQLRDSIKQTQSMK